MKNFYGVFCDYSHSPVKRKVISLFSSTIPHDETTDYYSITWFSSHEDALWYFNVLEKKIT